MRKTVPIILAITGFLWSQNFEYVGTYKCKMCHNKTAKGAQFSVWEGTSHANAFETLLSEKAKTIAQNKELKTAPHEAPECLPCHTVGFGKGGYAVKDEAFWNPADDDKAGKKAVKLMENLKNVGCEVCHGAGSGYKSKKTMVGIYDGTLDPAEHGLLTSTEATCASCHNDKSPTFTSFNYDEMLKKIAHPIPASTE